MRLSGNLPLSRYAFAEDVAKRRLDAASAKTIFDVGAGDGIMKCRLEAAGFKWFGFDIAARDGIGRWDLGDPCPVQDVAADLVLWLDVIEHLGNPGLALDHIVATMAPGATLVVTTPNPRWSRSRLWALHSGYPACFTQADLDLNGHVFPVWPHILERMLTERGFAIAEYVTLDGATTWPGAPYSLRYPLRCAVAAMMMVLESRDPTACGMSYGVVANLHGAPGAPASRHIV
jgi:SAM-dependent methyltransferase